MSLRVTISITVLVLLGIAAIGSAQYTGRCRSWCVRKEIRSLTHEEIRDYIHALKELNQRHGNYFNKRYPITHYNFVTNPPIGANVHDTNFLPWHRYFVRQLELDLQEINPSICVPYWNWTLDHDIPANSPVFQQNYFGPGANSSQYTADCIPSGPFTYDKGWKIPQPTANGRDYCSPNYGLNFECDEFPGTECLKRGFFGFPTGSTTTTTSPPPATDENTNEDVALIGRPNGHGCIITAPAYLPAWENVVGLLSENTTYMWWANSLFCSVHNSVHRFIGGNAGQMNSLISPSDPIFFLHHGFLDKIFSIWQNEFQQPYSGNTYIGSQLVPVNSTDILFPFGANYDVPLTDSPITVQSVWNTDDLCYSYDD